MQRSRANQFNIMSSRSDTKIILQTIHDTHKISGRFLDIGCGAARYLKLAAKKEPQWEFIGIDTWIKKERRGNIELFTGDAASLQFENSSFDICSEFHALASMPADTVLLELNRVLRQGGIFLSVSGTKSKLEPYIFGVIKEKELKGENFRSLLEDWSNIRTTRKRKIFFRDKICLP